MKNQISIKEISKKLKDIFPQVADKYEIISLKSNYSEVKLLSNDKNLRPGNTISGPSMFELADLSFYIAIMASIDLGDKSVTTNVSINFIKKPLLSNLLAISKNIPIFAIHIEGHSNPNTKIKNNASATHSIR